MDALVLNRGQIFRWKGGVVNASVVSTEMYHKSLRLEFPYGLLPFDLQVCSILDDILIPAFQPRFALPLHVPLQQLVLDLSPSTPPPT
jgi:hypothetical protein